MRGARICVLAATLGIPALNAQVLYPEQQPQAQAPSTRSGFQVENVSVFMTYYSILSEDFFPAVSGTRRTSEGRLGGSATVKYGRSNEKSAFSIAYSPSYIAGIRYPGRNASNHALIATWRSKLNGRWDYDIFASAGATSANDVLFTPTLLANTAAAPASFDDLVSALLAGKFTNGQLASILTGTSVLDSPAAMLIYGERIFTSQVQGGVSYSYSSRLTIRFGGAANREQYLKSGTGPDEAQSGYILPHTSRVTASAGARYSLTPRTQLGVDASTSRTLSMVQDAYLNSLTLSLGRVMGRRWFAEARGGVGFIATVRRSNDLPGGAQYEAGGSIGYKTSAHTLIASAMRSASDAYGFGASSSMSATGAWNWDRPGSAWWVSSSFGQERLTGAGFPAFTSWRANTRIGRSFGGRVAVLAEYGYIDYSGLTGLGGKPINQHAARLAVGWGLRRGRAR